MQIMGVLNVTPDSFYDGGRYTTKDKAIFHAKKMLEDGADIIDIGGESSRPGAEVVSTEEELGRVIDSIKAIKSELNAKVSIDSSNPVVIKAALEAGADMVNDIRALSLSEEILPFIAEKNVPVCLMHMQNQPATMQIAPSYIDVVAEVKKFLQSRIDVCVAAGINKSNIIIDVGFGFGKSLQHNLSLLKNLSSFRQLGCKILVGLSRKSMIYHMLQLPVEDRLAATIALNVMALRNGADIFRVHDVLEHKQALTVAKAAMVGYFN